MFTAILVKMLAPTASKPHRIKAVCPKGTQKIVEVKLNGPTPHLDDVKAVSRLICPKEKFDFVDICPTDGGWVALYK